MMTGWGGVGAVERSGDTSVDFDACLARHSKAEMKAWTKKKQQKGIIQRKGGMLEESFMELGASCGNTRLLQNAAVRC